jgi:hypothetical protein
VSRRGSGGSIPYPASTRSFPTIQRRRPRAVGEPDLGGDDGPDNNAGRLLLDAAQPVGGTGRRGHVLRGGGGGGNAGPLCVVRRQANAGPPHTRPANITVECAETGGTPATVRPSWRS